MHQFIDEIDDQPYMRGDFVLNKLIQACKYLYREEFERMISEQRIATKDNSDVFTPERLLGVKSNKGFVTAVYQYKWNNEGFVVDFDDEGQYQPSAFKYYISDDSDETVSFEEYVRMFYEE